MKAITAALFVLLIAVVPVAAEQSDRPVWIEIVGWTLVHSVWQLALVGFLAAMIDFAVRRRSASVQYAISAVALGGVLVLPVLTWAALVASRPARVVPARQTLAQSAIPVQSRPMSDSPLVFTNQNPSDPRWRNLGTEPIVDHARNDGISTDRSDRGLGESPDFAPHYVPIAMPDSVDESTPIFVPNPDNGPVQAFAPIDALQPTQEVSSSPAKKTAIEQLREVFEPRLPWLVCFWFLGVGMASLRPICGIWSQWKLRRVGLSPVPSSIALMLTDIARRMRVTRTIKIAQSLLVQVPVVVGYLHPMILLPASVITGLTPSQLEAVLAHELAHIRRHDWLINALQVLAETVLFYHPTVWWLSRRLSGSRELCCDDLALGQLPDRAVLARALLLLEELRQTSSTTPKHSLTMAANGGRLIDRIRRLRSQPPRSEPSSRNWLAATILLMAFAVLTSLLPLAMPPIGAEEEASNPPSALKKVDVPQEKVPGSRVPVPADDLAANEWEPGDESNPRQRLVRVIDETNKPVAGANVSFQFEISKQNTYLSPLPVLTDQDGVARIAIPDLADRVGISVTADGFGEGSVRRQAASGKSTIVLKRGHVVRVRPVDREHRLLKDAVPLLAGTNMWGREFLLDETGAFRSPSVALTRKYFRVACSQEAGPILFSDPVDVLLTPPGDNGVYEVTLRPGVRLEGRLDESVPRPITEGYVELMISEDHANGFGGDYWAWEDFTSVRPDGTFTFESLPGGGHVQMQVLVDGHISKNMTFDELANYARKYQLADEIFLAEMRDYHRVWPMVPQMVPLDQPQVNVTIPCVKTASCDFRLLDPAGNPVPKAEVSFGPNGWFPFGNLFIPSHEQSTALLVDGLRTGNYLGSIGIVRAGEEDKGDPSPHGQESKRYREWVERSFLRAKADDTGRVQVRNLPPARETFHVYADGFALPVSPYLDDEELARRNLDDDSDRYGVAELVSGATIEKTIYLERNQMLTDREVTIVNPKGQPLEGVSVTVAEIRVGPNDWQTWSPQRFGPMPKGVTNALGRVMLRLPDSVDKQRVQRILLGVNFNPGRNPNRRPVDEPDPNEKLFISRAPVEIPLARDDGVIMILPNPEKLSDARATYPGIVRYGKLEELLPNQSLADWLKKMIEQPTLVVLRKLLSDSKLRYPEPVELINCDTSPLSTGEKESVQVAVVSDGKETLAVVKAQVRPRGGILDHENDLSSLPECAFVFDRDGKLLAALGGELGVTGSNRPDRVELMNLGPKDDWFVRAKRYEADGPYEVVTSYYRLTKPIVKSLRVLHMTHSGSWSMGPEEAKRFGELGFDSPKTRRRDMSPIKELALAADGVEVMPRLLWDGDRKRFVGPPTANYENHALYSIDAPWSQDFEARSPKHEQLVIDGGEYDYGYSWHMAVQKGDEVLVTLSIPQRDGPPLVIERTLSAGQQRIYFGLTSATEDEAGKVELWVDDPDEPQGRAKLQIKLPLKVGDRPQELLPVTHTINLNDRVRIVDRGLAASTEHVTLDIQLRKNSLGPSKHNDKDSKPNGVPKP